MDISGFGKINLKKAVRLITDVFEPTKIKIVEKEAIMLQAIGSFEMGNQNESKKVLNMARRGWNGSGMFVIL